MIQLKPELRGTILDIGGALFVLLGAAAFILVLVYQ